MKVEQKLIVENWHPYNMGLQPSKESSNFESTVWRAR